MRTTYTVEHREHVSSSTYEALVEAFERVTGEGEHGELERALDAATSAQDWETSLGTLMGDSGFGRAFAMDHGRWLGFSGTSAKATKYLYGNPVVAGTILRHDVRTSLQVPLSLLIFEDADGHGCMAYDVPSSLMGHLDDPRLREAAAALDAKVAAFVEELTGVAA
jgi:uncharacterized protein (DUF302 family)